MSKSLDKDLELIDEAMDSFVQAMSRPRAWENIATRAGISVDRPGAVLLHFLEDSKQESCHLSELANKLGIEAPSVTRKVQQLERQKLVRRVPDPTDRRAHALEVTAQGRKILERLHKAKHDIFAEVITDWPVGDRHNFATLFYRLSQDMLVSRQNREIAFNKKGTHEPSYSR